MLSETKNPVKTLKIAAPTALAIVGVLYMLANVSSSRNLHKSHADLEFRLHISLPCQRKKSWPLVEF